MSTGRTTTPPPEAPVGSASRTPGEARRASEASSPPATGPVPLTDAEIPRALLQQMGAAEPADLAWSPTVAWMDSREGIAPAGSDAAAASGGFSRPMLALGATGLALAVGAAVGGAALLANPDIDAFEGFSLGASSIDTYAGSQGIVEVGSSKNQGGGSGGGSGSTSNSSNEDSSADSSGGSDASSGSGTGNSSNGNSGGGNSGGSSGGNGTASGSNSTTERDSGDSRDSRDDDSSDRERDDDRSGWDGDRSDRDDDSDSDRERDDDRNRDGDRRGDR